MADYIDIVFSGEGGSPYLTFAEVETPEGQGLSLEAYGGEWVKDGVWSRLRIPNPARIADLEGALRRALSTHHCTLHGYDVFWDECGEAPCPDLRSDIFPPRTAA